MNLEKAFLVLCAIIIGILTAAVMIFVIITFWAAVLGIGVALVASITGEGPAPLIR